MCCLKGYVSGWIAKLVSGCLKGDLPWGAFHSLARPFCWSNIGSSLVHVPHCWYPYQYLCHLQPHRCLHPRWKIERSDLSDSSSLDVIVVYPRGMFLMYVFACIFLHVPTDLMSKPYFRLHHQVRVTPSSEVPSSTVWICGRHHHVAYSDLLGLLWYRSSHTMDIYGFW